MKSRLVIASTFIIIAVYFIIQLMFRPGTTPEIEEEGLFSDIKKEIKRLDWNIDVNKIYNLVQPSIGIKSIDTTDETLPVGSSKFGGNPDLPIEQQWPTFSGVPMAFMAQINLSEISKLHKDYDLPHEGWLYFFIYVNDEDYHFPEETGEYRILYYGGSKTGLESREFPDDLVELGRFKQTDIELFNHFSVPSRLNRKVTDLHLSKTDSVNFEKVSEGIWHLTGADEEVHHQILGEATSLLGDVNDMWASNYIIFENYENSVKLHKEELAQDFMLLFELDMFDKRTGFKDFGGNSSAYFGIRRTDLRERKFQKAVLIFQSR